MKKTLLITILFILISTLSFNAMAVKSSSKVNNSAESSQKAKKSVYNKARKKSIKATSNKREQEVVLGRKLTNEQVDALVKKYVDDNEELTKEEKVVKRAHYDKYRPVE